jgi:DNA polymerase-1
VALVEARCIPLVAQTYNRGISIDKDAAVRLKAKLVQEGDTAYTALKRHYPEIDSVNLGSPKQVSELLYVTWGLTPPKLTTNGAPSTDKFALHTLAETYPQARLLRDYRESQYNTAKYADATLASLEYNGGQVVRPQAKIFGTYTSRMTYYSKQGKGKTERPTGIALHQWKRGADFRDLISVPEGYDLVELDFAGQEFGLMAVASGDERMLSLREDGEDAHSYMGAQLACVDYKDLIKRVHAGDKEAANHRKLGKFANLSFQYRIGAKTATVKARVEYGLDLTQQFVQGMLDTYKRTYQRVTRYWIDTVNKSKSCGYAETYAGRRINLNGNWMDKRVSWGLESTAINYPIQGTGGDQKYLALAIARNMLPALGGYFYFELHDGLFFILPKARSKEGMFKLRYALSNLPYEKIWGVKFPIKFPVDGKIGPSWGQLKGVEE